MPDASWGPTGAQGPEETPGEPGGDTAARAMDVRADVWPCLESANPHAVAEAVRRLRR